MCVCVCVCVCDSTCRIRPTTHMYCLFESFFCSGLGLFCTHLCVCECVCQAYGIGSGTINNGCLEAQWDALPQLMASLSTLTEEKTVLTLTPTPRQKSKIKNTIALTYPINILSLILYKRGYVSLNSVKVTNIPGGSRLLVIDSRLLVIDSTTKHMNIPGGSRLLVIDSRLRE